MTYPGPQLHPGWEEQECLADQVLAEVNILIISSDSTPTQVNEECLVTTGGRGAQAPHLAFSDTTLRVLLWCNCLREEV